MEGVVSVSKGRCVGDGKADLLGGAGQLLLHHGAAALLLSQHECKLELCVHVQGSAELHLEILAQTALLC